MRCFGITKKIRLCKNKTKFIYCRHHVWQPISIILVIAGFAGLYQDLLRPIYNSIKKDNIYTIVFPDLNLELKEKDMERSFIDTDIMAIKKSMRSPILPNNRCPCGSGKKYKECHSPLVNITDENYLKGPGFNQSFIFGYREPINGIHFQKRSKGEIKLLKNNDPISIGKFYTMDYSIILNRIIIRSLDIREVNEELIFSGLLEAEGDVNKNIQLVIGTPFLDSIIQFEAFSEGKKIRKEKGRWMGFIGEKINPMENIKYKRNWFRFFRSKGFLIDTKTNKQIEFKMKTQINQDNIYTISLPFRSIELAHPKVVTKSFIPKVSLELERENISWDLIVHSEQFIEKSRRQKDSYYIEGLMKSENMKEPYEGVRKLFIGPRKLRICISKTS